MEPSFPTPESARQLPGPQAEQAIRQVRDFVMILVGPDRRALSWNEGVRHILGWNESAWLGQPIDVAFTPDDVAAGVPARELQVAQREGRADDNRWMRRRNGERFFASGSVTPVRGADGETVAFLKVFQDATDREAALEAERQARADSERQAAALQAVIDAIPDALYIGTADGIRQCNAPALALMGAASIADLQAPVGELRQRFRVRRQRDGPLVDTDDLPFMRALGGTPATLETWATRPSGEDVYIRSTAAPIVAGGAITGAVAVNSDLTEHIQLEQERLELARVQVLLRERDEQFRALVSGVRDYAIFTIDTQGRITSWHVGAQLMKGYGADEAIGMPFEALFMPEDRAAGRPAQEMDIAARTGEFKGEGLRLRRDGSSFLAAVVMTALRGPGGELLGFLKLTQDITTRREAEQEREAMLRDAQAARAEAERIGRSKDEFLATISHELRTPLGAILGWARLLERGVSGTEQTRQGLAAIQRNARVQVQLIEDLLDMSRIESGQLRLEMQSVDPASVVSGAVEAVLPAAGSKGIEVRTALDSQVGHVWADPARLQQVVWNLLSNAVKFTPDGGEVLLTAVREGGMVELRVQDNGQGMAPEFLERAFDRFQQADATRTRRYGGLGLGLAIVRELTELHGGTVRAESAGPGAGAVFTVSLPALAARPPAWPLPGDDLPPPAAPPAVPRPLGGARLLLVDDDADGRAVAGVVLRTAGAQVLAAGSAEEALAIFQAQRPDAILCDIGMPGHDGHELIRWVREHEAGTARRTPAAAFTAFTREEDRVRALAAGYDAHLAKPLDPDALVDAVAALLQRAG